MIDISSLSRTAAWRLEDSGDGVGFLVFNLPDETLNKLSEAVLEDLDRILTELGKDETLRALVVLGGKPESGTFIAGADINEIRSVTDANEATLKAGLGQSVLHKLSTMSPVTIAAIHGNCLGGGAELAFACDMRVASHSPKTRIGLPEVQLGILPGFGGTQRLPRLIGLSRALPVILGGKPLEVRKAYKLGVVDRVVYPDLLRRTCIDLAREALEKGGKSYRPRKSNRTSFLMRCLEKLPPGRTLIRNQARKGIDGKVGRHYPAPYFALDAMVTGFSLDLEKGLNLEAKLIGELIASPVSKNLIDLFLTSEEARRGRRGSGDGLSAQACSQSGTTVGLLGAGVMGGGLAALTARKGFRVRMKDIHREALQTGYKKIDDLYRGRVKRRRMTKSELSNCMAMISGTTEYSGFENTPLVIEAVVENMDIKKQVLREVEATLDERAIFASNTSALSITELASAANRPERVVGLHFFNPVDRMPLVEVIRGEKTSDEAVEAVESFARKLGKVPVRCGDGPGFLVNRILGPYLNEATRLFEEGYSPVSIDAAIREFGMPMGPFELLDEVGLDVGAKVGVILHEAFGERARPPELLSALKENSARLGKKTGRGFYIHGGKSKKPNDDMLRHGGTGGSGFKADDQALWIRRLVYPMVNEAARALEEKIVERPSDVDLAKVFGTGFAPFRGGPLRYADSVGVTKVVDGLRSLRDPRHVPCELLDRLARSGDRIYSLGESAGESRSTAKVESAGT